MNIEDQSYVFDEILLSKRKGNFLNSKKQNHRSEVKQHDPCLVWQIAILRFGGNESSQIKQICNEIRTFYYGEVCLRQT